MRYVINGSLYNCSKKEAMDIATGQNTDQIYIIGKDNHWRYTAQNGGKWFLACGGHSIND